MNPRVLGLLAVLTLCAGYVDALGFLGFGVFVANMTGNTVLLGGAIVAHFGVKLPVTIDAAATLISLVTFVIGIVIAALIFRAEQSRTQAQIVLGLVVLLLLAGAAAFHWGQGSPSVSLGIGLLSTAMGMQSVIAKRRGVGGIWTTVITGSLVTAVLDLIGSELGGSRRLVEGGEQGTTWVLYLAGAVVGSIALAFLGRAALWPAAIIMALLAPFV